MKHRKAKEEMYWKNNADMWIFKSYFYLWVFSDSPLFFKNIQSLCHNSIQILFINLCKKFIENYPENSR